MLSFHSLIDLNSQEKGCGNKSQQIYAMSIYYVVVIKVLDRRTKDVSAITYRYVKQSCNNYFLCYRNIWIDWRLFVCRTISSDAWYNKRLQEKAMLSGWEIILWKYQFRSPYLLPPLMNECSFFVVASVYFVTLCKLNVQGQTGQNKNNKKIDMHKVMNLYYA